MARTKCVAEPSCAASSAGPRSRTPTEQEARRLAPAVHLHGYFEHGESDDEVLGRFFVRVNAFGDVQHSIDVARRELAAADGQRLELVARRPARARCIAVSVELTTSPKPALVGLERLGPTWWQGTVGAPRAEIALREKGTIIGYVVRASAPTD